MTVRFLTNNNICCLLGVSKLRKQITDLNLSSGLPPAAARRPGHAQLALAEAAAGAARLPNQEEAAAVHRHQRALASREVPQPPRALPQAPDVAVDRAQHGGRVVGVLDQRAEAAERGPRAAGLRRTQLRDAPGAEVAREGVAQQVQRLHELRGGEQQAGDQGGHRVPEATEEAEQRRGGGPRGGGDVRLPPPLPRGLPGVPGQAVPREVHERAREAGGLLQEAHGHRPQEDAADRLGEDGEDALD